MAAAQIVQWRGGCLAQWQRLATAWNNNLWPVLIAKLGANKFLLASSSKWYPPFSTKVSRSLARFTLPIDLNQIELYFEATISNSYSWQKNIFQWYIICLCLMSFAKKSSFSKTLSHFACRPTETLNQDLRPLSDSFQHHKFNGILRFNKWASIENHIFWDKPYYLDLHEISITWYLRLCFRNRAYLWTRIDK